MRTDEERLELARELNPSVIPEKGLEIEDYVIKVKKRDGVKLVTLKDPHHRQTPAFEMKSDLAGTPRALDAIYRWLLEIDRTDEAKAAAKHTEAKS